MSTTREAALPSTAATPPEATPGETATAAHPRRRLALIVLAIAQLMVVLDATIVNIALPQAQQSLGITDADRQWVVTAYTLAFGGLLLLGGRIADFWGRKRTFLVGAVGFAGASALGGLANSGELLFAARALQGAFGALLAPAGLALLTVLFVEAKERAKAFAVYGAIAGGGAAVGLVLGGVLTEYTDWRWCLLVNIPVALVAVLLAVPVVPESRAHGDTRYDIPGAIAATLGLVSLVYGFTQAAEKSDGWESVQVWSFIGAGLALLVLFVVIEIRSSHPLLPLRILLDRTRGGAFLSSMITGAGLMGAFLFLTYYFQGVLQYTPVEAGLKTLPVSGGVFVAAGLASALVPRLGPKPLMVAGALIASAGMFWLTGIEITDSFTNVVLPAELVLGLGLGFTFVPLSQLALVGVPEHDAGAASATLNATQQVGGSLGVAVLNSVAITALNAYLTDNMRPDASPQQQALVQAQAAVESFTTAFMWGGILLATAAVVALVLVRVRKEDLPAEGGAVHMG